MIAPDMLPYLVTHRKGVTIVQVKGLLVNHKAMAEVRERLCLRIEGTKEPLIILDFQDTVTISAQMLGVVMAMLLRIKHQEGQMRICNLNMELNVAFVLMKLDEIVPIDDDIDASIHAYRHKVERAARIRARQLALAHPDAKKSRNNDSSIIGFKVRKV